MAETETETEASRMGYRLYAELGNTNLHLGLWHEAWVHEARMPVAGLPDSEAWEAALRSVVEQAGLDGCGCEGALLCASTPRRTHLVAALRATLGVRARVLGWDVTLQMSVRYTDPATFGQDRLLAAFAAADLAGRPCVVMDAGTCITCEAVTAEGEVQPVGIAPGLPVLIEAVGLAAPHLSPALAEVTSGEIAGAEPPATSTRESLLVGLRCQLVGTARKLAGVALQMLGPEAATPVVATGGDGALLAEALGGEGGQAGMLALRAPVHHLPRLCLDGLRLLDERGAA